MSPPPPPPADSESNSEFSKADAAMSSTSPKSENERPPSSRRPENSASSTTASIFNMNSAAKPPTTTTAATSSSSSSSLGDPFALNDALPWVEKYRPSELDQLISHSEILETVKRLIQSNRLPHLLFYGPAGTGKTTAILAIARMLNGPSYRNQVLELNASDDRGIDVVREQIKDFASSRQLFNAQSSSSNATEASSSSSSGVTPAKNMKLIILDECDSMTSAAQFALRRVIEAYTRNVRFCLIGNYVNRIIPALQSRCTKFRFGPLSNESMTLRIREIATAEQCRLTDDGLAAIVRLSGGDMRKCLNVLQSCHMAIDKSTDSTSQIDEIAVHNCTGTPLPSDMQTIQHLLFNETMSTSYNTIQQLAQSKGLAVSDMVTQLHEICLRTVLPVSVKSELLSQLSDVEMRLASGSSEKIQLAGLISIYQIAKTQAKDYETQRQQQQSNAIIVS